jgi:hypothetical protein
MKTIFKYFGVTLCLLILVSVLSCVKRTVSECQSKKIELLLEDIFKKKAYYIILGPPQSLDSNERNLEPIDSSRFFNYLYSENLNIPKKEFYLHWDKSFEPSYPDSVRLKVIDDPKMKKKDAHVIEVILLEVNSDTTKLKISFVYSSNNNIFKSKGEYSYLFDEKNCKWNVLDSSSLYY